MDTSLYLQRYAYPKELLGDEPVSPALGMVVTIPCYNEPELIKTLHSLHQCKRPHCDVEVIVLINQPENAGSRVELRNRGTFQEALVWAHRNQSPSFRYFIRLEKNLPEKWSGVGLARKMVMDEAVRRFRKAGNPEGIILGFDADATCRDNYLVTVEMEFEKHQLNAGSIHFEHPLEGDEKPRLYEGIINYELHLRYFIMAQRYAGFPYAFHAIGSSMAVRGSVYEKQGGMNRRKAGEDFYFLHKVIPLGRYKEINDTCVFPSPRVSDRVPFGTGKAMTNWMNHDDMVFKTYHPDIFESLKQFFDLIPALYQAREDTPRQIKLLDPLTDPLKTFLFREDITGKLTKINHQSPRYSIYRDRFFNWFDGLKLLRYAHFGQSGMHPPVPLDEAIEWLDSRYSLDLTDHSDHRKMLSEIRAFNILHPAFYVKRGDPSDQVK